MKKKQSKKQLNSVVSGVLATSILTSSCTCYSGGFFTESEEDLYKKYEPSGDVGDNLLSIVLNPEDTICMIALQRLGIDIFNDPQVAQEVVKNPTTVLSKYGFNGEIKVDDAVMKILLALGNEEINNTIKEKNMPKFIELCKKNGYISDKFSSTFFSKTLSKEQIKKLYLEKKNAMSRMNVDNIETELFAIAGIIAIAVVAVLVVAGVGVAWNVGAGYNTVAAVNNAVRVGRMYKDANDFEAFSVLDIVPLKSGSDYQLVEEYLENTINESIDYIKSEYPEILNKYSEEDLKQFVYNNIKSNLK